MNKLSPADRERLIEDIGGHVEGILELLNLDLKDPNLTHTPKRVAKMYLEMFHGLFEGSEPEITTFPNDEGYRHMMPAHRLLGCDRPSRSVQDREGRGRGARTRSSRGPGSDDLAAGVPVGVVG